MTFNSDDNKKMLWDVLSEDGYFNDVRPSFFKNIQYEFDNTINELDTITNNQSLMEKNKHFIEKFTYKLKTFKNIPSSTTSLEDINESLDTQKFKEIRQEQLNSEFNNKKSEMDNLLIAKKPDDINFAELGEDEPIKDIDSILQKTIQQRNLDINDINESYDQNKAKKWLGNEKKITFKEETENIVLETTEIQPDSLIEPPTHLPPPPPTGLSLPGTEILDMLQKILTNQDTILSKLTLLDTRLEIKDP